MIRDTTPAGAPTVAPAGAPPPASLLRALRAVGWVLLPAFAALVLLFVRERACFDRYALLPAVGGTPRLAYLVSGVYVAAHVWVVCAYAVTVRATGELLPGPTAMARAWNDRWTIALGFALVMGVEYVPAGIWEAAAHTLGLC
jgi:hypothetical protein